MVFGMTPKSKGYAQVQNIIQRAQALILNVKLLGADVTHARELLENSKSALNKKEYESALQFAMASLKEVMRLKKDIKSGKITRAPPPPPSRREPAVADLATTKEIPLAEPAEAAAASTLPADSDRDVPEEAPAATSDAEIVNGEGKIFGHEFIMGLSYLIEEGRADKCFIIFQNLMEQDFTGLVITRTNPKIINRRYSLEKGEMLWLTDRESTTEPTIAPSLENMIYVAEEFIDAHKKPLLLLDGLEYLISNNTYNSVLRFIRRLVDKISESDAILLIGVSQGAIQDQELKLLEKEMVPIFM